MRSKPYFQRDRHVPDYSARRVQLRIAVLVFAVMTVLALMQKAGQPETWQWMNFKDPAKNGPEFDSKPIDTRIGVVEGDSNSPVDVIGVASSNSANASIEKKVGSADEGDAPSAEAESTTETDQESFATARKPADFGEDFVIAESDFWQKSYEKLSSSDKSVLFNLTRSLKFQEYPNEANADAWPALSARIEKRRQEYYAKVLQRIESLDASRSDEQNRWLAALQNMQTFWDGVLQPGLKQLANETTAPDRPDDGPAVNAAEIAYAETLLNMLDEIALSMVKDNAMTSKQSDMQAWFSIIDYLKRTPDSEFHSASIGSVSYVQLFEQPDLYRGKVVTIVGEVRGAYWVNAPANDFGVERYYVFWVRPEDGSNNPIAVYALSLPPGFPTVNRKSPDSDKEVWKEPVFVHGIFFKKWVYLSQDGSRVCPLLLAKTVQWQPVQQEEETSSLPGIPAIFAMLIVIGLVAIAIAFFAFHLSSRELPGSRLTRQTDKPSFDSQQLGEHSAKQT